MSGTLMIAQVQLVGVSDPANARLRILEHAEEIRAICDGCDPVLVKLGGGFRELEIRVLDTRSGPMVITHIIVDTRDAMGANAVNTMAEKLAPSIAAWTGGRTYLRILSNLADRRLARARCVWRTADIDGEAVRDGIVLAGHFAEADPLPRGHPQQGHHERHQRRGAGHRQRHPGRRSRRACLCRARRPLQQADALGGHQ